MFPVKTFLLAGVLAAAAFPAVAQSSHRHNHAGHSHGAHDHSHDGHHHGPVKARKKPAKKAVPNKASRSARGTQEAQPVRTAAVHGHAHHSHAHGGHAHGIETENLFGFVLGSDVEPKGTRSIAMEAISRFGKRGGTYNAFGGKVEFAYGLTDNLSVAGAVLGAAYNIKDVPDFENTSRMRLNGLGGEARWRLLNRETQGVGLTLHIEPVWATSDELTGVAARKWGAENKIILDTMLVPQTLYAAFNVIHEMEVVKERGAAETERAAKIGAGVALAAAVTKNIFLGAEARYLHAYDGLGFDTFAGRAFYIGPTAHVKFDNGLWASLAWNVQVAGSEKGVTAKYDLTNFERNLVRVKVGYDF